MSSLAVEYNALNYMEAAIAPAEAEYKAEVMADTWGHLAPEKDKDYFGFMLFALGAYGDWVLIECEVLRPARFSMAVRQNDEFC